MSIATAPSGTPLVIPNFTGDYFFLSNFYRRPLLFSLMGMLENPGIRFPTSEHAFQAAKYKSMRDYEHETDPLDYVIEVANEPDPRKAKRLGGEVKIDPKHWDSIKDSVMREVVFEKFVQHSDLREQLLATHAAMLVEGNTWGDTYWGRVEGKGLNHLGVILMETRGYFHFHARGGVRLRPPIDNIIAG